MSDIERILSVAESLAAYHVGIWDVDERFEIQKIDETAPDDFTDASALAKVVELASKGNVAAIAALYLDGRPVKDDRCFLTYINPANINERRPALKEATHTPGPWETSVMAVTGREWQVCRENGGDSIASIDDCGDPMESAANAQLMAAAPDLLAACRGLLEQIDIGVVYKEIDEEIVAIRAAITRAKGSEP